MPITIYHNPRCSKSRTALQLLQDAGAELQVVEYLKAPLTEKELRALHAKANMPLQDMLRKGEAIYKELNLKDATDDQLFQAVAEHPILLERAIVVKGNKAMIARPPEKVEAFL